jgi:hypothetical protein
MHTLECQLQVLAEVFGKNSENAVWIERQMVPWDRKCSSRPFQWMVTSVGSDNLNRDSEIGCQTPRTASEIFWATLQSQSCCPWATELVKYHQWNIQKIRIPATKYSTDLVFTCPSWKAIEKLEKIKIDRTCQLMNAVDNPIPFWATSHRDFGCPFWISESLLKLFGQFLCPALWWQKSPSVLKLNWHIPEVRYTIMQVHSHWPVIAYLAQGCNNRYNACTGAMLMRQPGVR